MDRDLIKYHNVKKLPSVFQGVFEPWFLEKYWKNIRFSLNTIVPSNILVAKWMKHLKQMQIYDFRNNGFSLDKHHINNLQYDNNFDFSLCGNYINFKYMPQNLSWLIACAKYIVKHNADCQLDKKKKLVCDYYDWIPDNFLTEYKEIMIFKAGCIALFSLPIRFNDLDWRDTYYNKEDNAGIYHGLITKQDYQIYKQSNPEIYNLLYDEDILNYKFTKKNRFDLYDHKHISKQIKRHVLANNNINLPLHLFNSCLYSQVSLIIHEETEFLNV